METDRNVLTDMGVKESIPLVFGLKPMGSNLLPRLFTLPI